MKKAALPFLLSRGWVVLLIILGHGVSFESIPAREELSRNPVLRVTPDSAFRALSCVLSSADSAWYAAIAESGYDADTQAPGAKNWAFFPLLPLLLRTLNTVTGSSLASGLIISGLCFFASLVLLQIAMTREGFSDESSDRAVWLLCFFPVSYFFSAPITEALFLMLSLLCWIALRNGRLLTFGAMFALLSASRPTGAMLAPAFLAAFLQSGARLNVRAAGALLLMPFGLLGYMFYLQRLTGDAFAFVRAQEGWERNTRSIAAMLTDIAHDPGLVMSPWIFNWLSIAAAGAALLAAVVYLRRRNFAFALWIAVPILLALATASLLSLPRFVMALVPFTILLADWARTPNRERCLLAIFAGMLGLLAALYGHHVTAAMA